MNRNKKQKQSTENSEAHENSLYIDQRTGLEIDKAGVHYGAGPEAKGLFYF